MDIAAIEWSIEQLVASTSTQQIKDVLSRLSNACYFEHFAWFTTMPGPLNQPEIVIMHNYPAIWEQHYYSGSLIAHDPVVAYGQKYLIGNTWDKISLMSEQLGRDIEVMHRAFDFGLCQGVSIPYRTTSSTQALLSFATTSKGIISARLLQAQAYASTILPYLQQATEQVLVTTGEMSNMISLTSRENECLRWAADGKTTWEISQILGTSERTALFHLNNATKKLGATSRQHAIAKAAMLGIIEPDFAQISGKLLA